MLVFGNGPAEQSSEPAHIVQVVLTYDKNTMACQIGCSEQSLDVICQVLASASRQADVSYRVAAGIAAQQQIKQHNSDLALAESLLNRRQ